MFKYGLRGVAALAAMNFRGIPITQEGDEFMGFLLDLLLEPLVNLVVAAIFWVIAFPVVFMAAAIPICAMSCFEKGGY